MYHNGESNWGFKKKFINKKAPRPSNFANKLLQKGIKFIADFNGLKEEEQKKKYYWIIIIIIIIINFNVSFYYVYKICDINIYMII